MAINGDRELRGSAREFYLRQVDEKRPTRAVKELHQVAATRTDADYPLKCDASASTAVKGFAKYFRRSPDRLGQRIPLHWISEPSPNALLLRRQLL